MVLARKGEILKSSAMLLYPAVDIYNGKCVRLTRGDFDQATVYYDNPLDAAKKWADLGAPWIHVVDLNGALEGKPKNLKPIEEIMTTINLPIQIGGGIRSQDTAEIFLTMGAGRIVLGSVAVEDPDLVQILALKYEERIAVGLDARDGKIAVHGWKETSDQDPLSLVKQFQGYGVDWFIYTDISRDGTLTGPNFDGIGKMAQAIGSTLIASGGFATLDDVKKCKELGVGGAILGRSLYEGKIDLKAALKLS